MIYFFYCIGGASLFVNSATLCIIIRKSSALTLDIRILMVFQQVSCLLSNAFLTLLFIPFFYTRIGAAYCVGILCQFIPYRYTIIFGKFLTMTMFSAFGIILIARHQILIADNSIFKMKLVTKYASFVIINLTMHILTVIDVLIVSMDRQGQINKLIHYPQLKWQERGLNWFLFDGDSSSAVRNFTYYGAFFFVPVICIFLMCPFIHMLSIVLRSRKNRHTAHRSKNTHIRHATNIIIQFSVLIIFLALPFTPAVIATLRDNVYAGTQSIANAHYAQSAQTIAKHHLTSTVVA